MNIREEFWYVNESQKFIKESLNLEKSILEESISAIYDTLFWIENSIYKKLADILHVELTDLPLLDTLALVGIDEKDKDVMLFINITHLVYLFENDSYKKKFLLGEMSCYELTCFVVLHEFGHLVHAVLSTPGNFNVQYKIRDYLNFNRQRYIEFKKRIKNDKKMAKFLKTEEEPSFIHKKYRNLDNEKQADNFAKKHIKDVKNYLNKK
jgi:hypothetical protein